MKKKTGFPSSIFLKELLMAAGLVFGMLQTACNSNPNENNMRASTAVDLPKNENWVDLNVRFKKGTNVEIRDQALRAIKKIILDSVNTLKAGKYPNFSLTIAIANNSDDSLFYGVVGIPSTSAAPIKDTTCTCARNCGVCLMIRTAATVPTGPVLGHGPVAANALGSIEEDSDGSGFDFLK